MNNTLLQAVLIVALAGQLSVSAAGSIAQQPVRADSFVGSVIDIDKATRNATIKTDAGEVVAVKADENTICLRIPAGEKTLAKAVSIQFADIAVGDRVLGHGTKSEKDFTAQRLVVMPKAEVEKKREHDLEAWRQRGISGIVRDLNPATGEINLELRGATAGRVIVTTTKADFRRYATDSMRFEDAQPSSFADVKVGDQMRALGAKSVDGRTFGAEEIVSGAFKTVGVTVASIDLQQNEIKATTLDQKKPIVISLTKDSVLHRIPPPLAAAIAQRALANRPANPGSNSGPALPTQKTASGPPVKAAPPSAAANQAGDVQQMIDALPNLGLAEIKPGDVLAVTSAIEKDDSRVTAIKLVAGVDLVLKALAPPPGKPQVVRLSAGLPTVFDFSVVPIN